MTASLPMYDSDGNRAANDRFWTFIRKALGEGPLRLSRPGDPWSTWEHPELLLSQTCSLPYRTRLRNKVRLVGTPDYGLRGCPPGYYRSLLVVRRHDRRTALHQFAGSVFARNDVLSQSGWLAAQEHLREIRADFTFDDRVLDTGSHAASAQAVLDRRADIAAIDAVTWGTLVRDRPPLAGLRVIARTRPTPGLPLITSAKRDPAPILRAVRKALVELPAATRARLMIRNVVEIPSKEYLAMPMPRSQAPAPA
jgi:ABC-type phosphate/phosphonate transport system substrate-binding protein